ncbi:PREDICTED: DNA ligase 6-like [Nelumbo nucifera]|uniref:DNA ligase 6-like n=1 Tax=Nelumbo nucifera TaxID=4432 RepID=A0A1U7ZK14_NELNU|nr:PREDICTED: DNA ligase 6-like [Nelumbo nucifera]
MAFPPSSTTKTLTLNSSELFVDSYKAFSQKSPQNSPPRSFTLLSQRSPLPPIPSDFAQSKLIPKTRFIVDGFRYSGDYSVSYFLSHFHSDHYAGLKTGWSKGLIFCSETTGRLLIEALKLSSLFVISLSLGEPVVIDGCEVTLVDANHCPGAVQFLFKIPRTEGKYERYVHTGDFRFCDSMTLEPVLSEYVGADAVFLDTTYCNPKFVFPSQDDSVNYIVEAIERIRAENQRLRESVLFLIATYVVGKERILVEISRRCNCMIHVDSRKMSILCILGFGGGGIFTEDVSVTDVHVVSWNVLGETWPYFRSNFAKMEEIMIERGYTKVVGFVPTGWMYEVRKDGFAVRTKDSFEIHLVPYSEHSSYNELREYVRFLRPKRVIPTVGLDVEKLDSKHAVAMQKHFAGLVDEMANKQEFLMGFHRKSRNKDEKEKGNISSDSNKELDKENEVKQSKEILERSPALREPDLQNSSMASDRDMEESIKEICDSLPPWVTREQMLDLLKHTKGNIVEAMSEFYERETELREQLTASNRSTTSQLNLSTISYTSLACISSSLPEMGSVKEHFIGIMKNSLVQDKKLSNMRRSIKSTVSPRKKATGVENKSNKKAKLGSFSESCRSDSKQYTITKFFSKIVPNASQVGEIGTDMAEQFPDTRNVLSSNMSELYKEEINQFLEVIDGGLSRIDAASILEKAKGDIHVALDVYYNNSGVDCDDNDGKLSVQSQPYIDNCSSGKETKSSEESENIPSLFMQGFSTTDVTATLVSLPLEKYSPVEHACWRQGQPAPYLHLARTFDLVEGERSKIKATGILCNMFRSLLALSPKEVLPAVYLCTNKIAADHENMFLFEKEMDRPKSHSISSCEFIYVVLTAVFR